MRRSLACSLFSAFVICAPALADEVDAGRKLYEESCMACHGATGSGGGELTGLLTIATPDLTTLSARNDGEFPMLKVIHIIDGRSGLRAHGGPMPVYGSVFSASSAAGARDYGAVLETRGRILSIALYLESIQG